MPPGELRRPWYLRLGSRTARASSPSSRRSSRRRASRWRGSCSSPSTAHAVLHVVTHEAPAGRVEAALASIRALAESRGEASALPVVSERGVEELGWA